MRYKTKPVKTAYVEAMFNKSEDAYVVQHVDSNGKPLSDDVDNVDAKEFHNTYDLVTRKPRVSKKATAVA